MKRVPVLLLVLILALSFCLPAFAEELTYTNINSQYSEYARNPDIHIGESIEFSGKVIQVIEGDPTSQYRIAVNGDSDSVFFVEYARPVGESRILTDDMVTVRGTSTGTITYQSTLGGQITIPACTASEIVEYKAEAVQAVGTQDAMSSEEFPTVAYTYSTSRYNYLYLAITNNTDRNVAIDVAVQYYDAEGKLVGISNAEERAFEKGTQIMVATSNDIPFTSYEYTITAKEETWYNCVNSALNVETTILPSKVILSVTNTGSVVAESVNYYILFLKDDIVVDVESGYVCDSDYEIKPQKTQFQEEKTTEEFDDALVFVFGRADK